MAVTLYDHTNPRHYQLIFVNEQGWAEVTCYIKYVSVGNSMAVQGCCKKGDRPHGMALHSYVFPNPTFHYPRIKDTNLSVFHPDSVNHHLVNNALISIIDPGIVADVHTMHTQITKKKSIKC